MQIRKVSCIVEMLSQLEESFENGKVRVCYEKDMTEYAVNWIGAEKLRVIYSV